MELDLDMDLDALYKELKTELKNEKEGVVKKHILVVDDDKNVLKLLKSTLESKYDITTMVNGMMAQQFLEKRKTDLILLDYEMPEMSGAEVLKFLRGSDWTKNIPVIFLTGVAQTDKIKEVLALEPQGYLLKPINVDRLKLEIRKILG